MATMSPTAVGLRMWCDIDPPDEYASVGKSAFRVSEFAVLSDGREITLVDDRGWGSWNSGMPPEEYLAQFTVRDIELGVYNVLLPDYADVDNPLPPDLAEVEAVGGAQDWELLARRLADHGIAATPAALRNMPRRVDISDRLMAHLRDGGR